MPLTISQELQSLIPPLTLEEFAQLETNIRQDGCRDPLIVWQETETLLDGHNRLKICTRHGLDYRLSEISLPDLDAAKAWMIANQLGRRNLTPEQMSYYRGEQYNLQKKQGKRTDLTSDQSEQKLQTTAERLAEQHHVSAPTIRRDGAYADGIEVLAQVLGPEVRQAILADEISLTRQDIRTLSLLLASDLENQAVAKAAQRDGVLAPTLQAMAHAVRCTICHRPLSDPVSISGGIGPICVGHGNGASGARESGSHDGAVSQGAGHALVLEPAPTAADDTAVDGEPASTPPGLFARYANDAVFNLEMVESYCRTSPTFLQNHPDHCRALQDACGRLLALLTPQEPTSSAVCTPVHDVSGTAVESASPSPATGPRQRTGKLIDLVFEALTQHQPCTNAQVAQITGEKPKRTHQALETLVAKGKVLKDDNKRYRLAE